ncbi:MAG: cytochrome c-type biogenesis protein [Gammaproteobacteria bacterium]
MMLVYQRYLPAVLKNLPLVFILAAALTTVPATWAADVPFAFKTPEQEQHYKDLAEQLRCLVCQNQSLADSNAELAQDLRNELYRMMVQGQSDEEIIDFLVTRYGDYVLFKPPVKTGTVLLWFGPFLLLIAAIVMVIRYTRRNVQQPPPELSSNDRQRLDTLLQRRPDGESG